MLYAFFVVLFSAPPLPHHSSFWGSPTAVALPHNLTSSIQDHLKAALLLHAFWSQHSLQSFHELCSDSPSSFLNKIFYSKRKIDILLLTLLPLKRSLRNAVYKTALLLLCRLKV